MHTVSSEWWEDYVENSRIKLAKTRLTQYHKTLAEIQSYLAGTREKVEWVLEDPTWGITYNSYGYPSIQALHDRLILDIKSEENSIFFQGEWKKLLDQWYEFLDYSADSIMTTASPILRFTLWSFLKGDQLVCIYRGIMKKYIVLDSPMQEVKWEAIETKRTKIVSPSCFLYDENWEIFFLVDNMFSWRKEHRLREITEN